MPVYAAPPLARDLEVIGPTSVRLWAGSSAPDTDFVARLMDVYPDRRSINLTNGIVRARYQGFREGESPTLIEPGPPYAYEIDLTGVDDPAILEWSDRRAITMDRTSTHRISDTEYLRRYEEERRRALEEHAQGSRAGERALNQPLFWTSHRDDAQQMDQWEEHAWLLAAHGLWTGTYYALQPDGSWRPWLPTALRPEAPPAPGDAAADWEAQESRRFPPAPARTKAAPG